MQPTLLHTTGNTEHKHSGTSDFFIRIFLIQQLMPKSVLTLIACYTTGLLTEIFNNRFTHRMIFRHHTEQISLCHKHPAIGTAPVSYSMFLVVCMITMIINLLFRTPEIAIIIQYLISGIIEILLITGQLTHTCQKRNCHECIVRPDSINVWPDAGNGTINQTRFTIIQMFGSLINVTQK